MNKLNQGPRVKIGSRIGSSTLQGVEEQDLCPLPKIRIHMANHLVFFLQMRMGESGTSLEAKAKFVLLDEISYT